MFDADPQTLCNIALLQQGALLVAHGIEIITRPSAGQLTEDYTGPDLTTITSKLGCGDSVETHTLIATLEEATSMVRRLAQVNEAVCPQKYYILTVLVPLGLNYPWQKNSFFTSKIISRQCLHFIFSGNFEYHVSHFLKKQYQIECCSIKDNFTMVHGELKKKYYFVYIHCRQLGHGTEKVNFIVARAN